MKKWVVILAAACSLFVISSVAADNSGPCNASLGLPLDPLLMEGGWRCAHEEASAHILTRKMSGTGIHEVAAVTVMPLPLTNLAQVLADVERYPEFMPYVEQCRILGRAEDHILVFQQLDFPFPISDRRYTVQMTISNPRAPSGKFDLHWELAEPQPRDSPGSGLLLMANRGFWKLTALADGRGTMVTYYIYTDPGGALPAWAVNIANTAAVPDVLAAVRARAVVVGATE